WSARTPRPAARLWGVSRVGCEPPGDARSSVLRAAPACPSAASVPAVPATSATVAAADGAVALNTEVDPGAASLEAAGGGPLRLRQRVRGDLSGTCCGVAACGWTSGRRKCAPAIR